MNQAAIKIQNHLSQQHDKSHLRRKESSAPNIAPLPSNSFISFDISRIPLMENRTGIIQPKLAINPPNDKYEQEADRMADQIMRMPTSRMGSISSGTETIQRKCASCEKEEEEALQRKPLASQVTPLIQTKRNGAVPAITPSFQSQLNATKGGGSPLPKNTKQFMSTAFGTDFSHVRIHTNSNAHQLNQGIQARAFTHGSDIYFNKGQFSPSSTEGKRLLAHELTHVVQQTAGNVLRKPNEKENNKSDVIRHFVTFYTKGFPDNVDSITLQKAFLKQKYPQLSSAELIVLYAKTRWYGDWKAAFDKNREKGEMKVFWESNTQELIEETQSSTIKEDRLSDGTRVGSAERSKRYGSFSKQIKDQMEAETDTRYWNRTNIPVGELIEPEEDSKTRIWLDIRDEIIAQHDYINNLNSKIRLIIKFTPNGIPITPDKYEQIIQIAERIKTFDDRDLELYLTNIRETHDIDELEHSVDKFLKFKADSVEKRRKVMELVSEGDWDVDSEASKLKYEDLFYLTIENRIKLIKEIVDGLVVFDEDERTIIKLIRSTPSMDIPKLVEELKKNNASLLKKLNNKIGDNWILPGSENEDLMKALHQVYIKSLEPKEAVRQIENVKIVLPWADQGLLKAINNVRFHYEEVELDSDGNVHIEYYINRGPIGMMAPPITVPSFEIIGVKFYADEPTIGAKEGQIIYMPAVSFISLHNKQFRGEIGTAIDVSLLFAGGAGLLTKGSKVAKSIAALDVALGAADIVINSYRIDIAKTEVGVKFLRTWDTVNSLIAVYGLARVAIELPGTISKLKLSFDDFRARKPNALDTEGWKKVGNDTENLVSEAEQVLQAAKQEAKKASFQDLQYSRSKSTVANDELIRRENQLNNELKDLRKRQSMEKVEGTDDLVGERRLEGKVKKGGLVGVGRSDLGVGSSDVEVLNSKLYEASSPQAGGKRLNTKDVRKGEKESIFSPDVRTVQAHGHVEERIMSQFHADVQSNNIPKEALEGKTLRMHIEQESCSFCKTGINDPIKDPGKKGSIVKFFKEYPGMFLEVFDTNTKTLVRYSLDKNTGKIVRY